MSTTSGKSTPETRRRATGFPRPYTDEERARLLAPIVIHQYGGKSWGGAAPCTVDPGSSRSKTGSERYGVSTDWADLDRTT
jgi:hypothetical protein